MTRYLEGSKMALKDEIRDIIKLKDDPEWQKMEVKRKVQTMAVEIGEAACLILKGLDPDEIDAYAPQLVDAAEEIFDEYFEAIDLPINDFLEGFVDSALRRGIGPAIYAFMNWLDR